MTAAFDAEYAAGNKISVRSVCKSNPWRRLTCTRSANKGELAGNIDNRPPLWRSCRVMRRQGFLLQHVFQLCPRGQPASAVVHIVYFVEIFDRCLVRTLVVTHDTCAVHRIVESSESADDLLDELLDELRICDITRHCKHLAVIFPGVCSHGSLTNGSVIHILMLCMWITAPDAL